MAQAQEAYPSEVVVLGADFQDVLAAGDSLVSGQPSIEVLNALTGATVSGVLVPASESLVGTQYSARFNALADGDVYLLRFLSGQTTALASYETHLHLVVTNTPATEVLLASREFVKTRGGITDASDDALLDTLVLGASQYIKSRCQREFVLRRYVETLRPPQDEDANVLTVSEWPLRAVESVTTREADGSFPVIHTTGFSFDLSGGLWFQDGSCFYRFPRENVVVYRAGYPAIPPDLREAAAALSLWLYRTGGKEGLSSERIGDYMYTRQKLSDLPPRLKGDLPDGMIEGVIAHYSREAITA